MDTGTILTMSHSLNSRDFTDFQAYCDKEKANCNDASKMYNHTCDIMDRLGADKHWERTCPEGVKSCFYGEGSYEDQSER